MSRSVTTGSTLGRRREEGQHQAPTSEYSTQAVVFQDQQIRSTSTFGLITPEARACSLPAAQRRTRRCAR
jgi:hypothetical protein